MDIFKPTVIPDPDPSRVVFISTRSEIPMPKGIDEQRKQPAPQSQPAQPARDYLTEILWLLTTARNLAADSGRDVLAQDLQDQIQALEGTNEEF